MRFESINTHILLSPHVFSMVESLELKIYGKFFFEYVLQILDGNDIEPAISENHNRMQIITSFA